MNKNLKKVISAVAALALSVSSFAALTVSAANYPDVPADADYAHAVDELTALDVVVGDENGNFLPDKEVTRAEFAAMLVGALGPAKVQMAASASSQTTKFPDVNDVGTGKMHWASGYITALAGDGTISGFDDGKFHPDEAVSYVQAMKMLVCSAGYDRWAVDRGGWETGYLSMANDIGIGDGVQVTGNSAALTRAQCAQMVANTIKAPVLEETGEKNWDGTPVLSQKNKTGRNWQSILTKNHDAYVVYGRVTETSKTASGGMDADEVTFQVERATNFEDEYYTRNDDPVEIVANVGDTDAVNQLRVYSEAIIRVNSYDEYELICLKPLSSNAEVTFAAADFDDTNSAYKIDADEYDYEKAGRMYAYISGSTRTTSYRLSTEDGAFTGDYYVNGVDVSDKYTFNEFVNNYIANNNVGEVTLVSESTTGSTASNGYYNTIMVTYYEDAIVESVDVDETETEIYFLDFQPNLDSSLVIDYEDDEVDYSVVKGGKDIDASEIVPYDVVSIAYDVTADNFAGSTFYDVIVSDRESMEGKGTVRDRITKDGTLEYQVDGTYYPVVGSKDDGFMVNKALDRNTTFVWYLDNFGRIAYVEEVSSDKNFAIVDNIYDSNDHESQYVKLIKKDGETETVTLSSRLDNEATKIEIENFVFNHLSGAENTFDSLQNNRDGKKEPQERVITYRVNSSNELTQITYFNEDDYSGAENEEYRESSNRIGQYTFSDATATLVVSESGDTWEIKYLDPTTLIDGDEYTAYFYDRSSSGVYGLAIVIDESSSWSKNTHMAAYVSTVTTSDEDYDYAIELYTAGSRDVTTLFISDDYDTAGVPVDFAVEEDDLTDNALAEGTPILYKTDASGAVTSVRTVFDQNNDAFIDNNDFSRLVSEALGTEDLQSLIDSSFGNYDDSKVDSNDRYKIVFGLVTGKYSNQVDLVTKYKFENVTIDEVPYDSATIANTVGKEEVQSYALTDETAVYVYDFNGQSRYNTLITAGGVGNVRPTSFNSRSWADGSNDTKAVMDVVSKPQYVVARVLDRDIMEIMVFVPEK